MKDVLRVTDRAERLAVTYRGKERARLVPSNAAAGRTAVNPRDHPACGMWKDREDMADPVAYIRKLCQLRYGHLFDVALPAVRSAKRKKRPVAVAKRAAAQKQRKAR